MQLFNFISKLFCRHTKKCIRIEYRVYNSMFRQFPVKRYSINNVTRCIKCNKVLRHNMKAIKRAGRREPAKHLKRRLEVCADAENCAKKCRARVLQKGTAVLY